MSLAERFFFHTFPRPKKDEDRDAALARALSILRFMKDVGIILAPELVTWEIQMPTGGIERLPVLQQRVCFTELATDELEGHSATFGPVTLSFDIQELRLAGATPVMYVPQGLAVGSLSQMATFCVKAAWHTKYVLERLQELKTMSDPQMAIAQFGYPLDPNATFTLTNTDPAGGIAASYAVPASNINAIMKHIGYRNIPFDHSIGMLTVFLNMFYPTDNAYSGELLGYYRQREWRIIGGGLNFNGRPIVRGLTHEEISQLAQIDPTFWQRELTVDGATRSRASFAGVFVPSDKWNFFDQIRHIFVPRSHAEAFREIAGDKIRTY
jgi:hypothetical protein